MKRLLSIIIFSLVVQFTYANHTKGGYMYYEYLGQGSNANKLRYKIVLKFYTACNLNANQFDPTINFTIFNGANYQLISNNSVTYSSSVNVENCTLQSCHECVNPIPSICYKITTYELTTDLDKTPEGYIVAYQRCCRITGINNIQNSSNVGETWTVTIPGTATAPGAEKNSSAQFALNDTAIICENSYFTFNFGASDPNNDSLSYHFCDAYNGGGTGNPTPTPSSAPPFSSVPYSGGYFGSSPMGGAVTINPFTGVVSGTAPGSGIYVLTVCVSEYKRGTNIKMGEVRKSLHIQVANCTVTDATLKDNYTLCTSFTETFSNLTPGVNIQSWHWDFGVTNATNDTSNLADPTFTYPDTGTYILKLVVNRGQACSDSATAIVRVYPGFLPDFGVAGQCKNTPIQFTNLTTAAYGSVNLWRWDFGDPLNFADTAVIPNPAYTYSTAGTYTVSFIVGTNKGCIDTVIKNIDVLDQAPLTVTHDTLICSIDTLQLSALGTGTVLWTPNYNIDDITSHFPLISPDIPTTYYVTLTDAFGCKGKDSVRVNVKDFVTLNAGNDTTICQTDPILLAAVSDGLYYNWTPPTGLNNPLIKNPVATALTSTTYHVISSIGKCKAEDDISIKVVPYPAPKASNDTAICFGDNAQLSSSGGINYSWVPTAFLNNHFISNPVSVAPTASVRYVVFVRDTLGCPKPGTDTVFVKVFQPIKADAGPRDTAVVLDEPLQLQGTGSTNYLWDPPLYLNSTTIANPVALPKNNIQYILKVSNSVGCFGFDTIFVKVFFIEPGFYVPNAFTPNGDGNNDVFRPVALGIKSLDRFMVFNRWGQMVFSTNNIGLGWDGTIRGKAQDAATYTWFAEGTDYKNRKITKKGTVILIR
ncbi:MAG: PKD domain-containing protein [Ferruginibacter sp.]